MTRDLLNNITKRNLTGGQALCEAGLCTRGLSLCAFGLHFLRYAALLLLLLFVGVNGVEAQTDYSGTYYIGSYGKDNKNNIGYKEGSTETNYYLCPTEDWIYYEYKDSKDNYTTTPNGQPFITSYQCKSSSKEYDATKAVWVITKHSTSEYYYIQQRKTGKYLVFNGKINTSKSANRIRVHLEGEGESYEPGENALFEMTTNPANSSDNSYLNGAYLFHPKKADDGYYLNISEGNQDALIGTSAKTDGPTASDFTKYVGGTLGQWNEANNTSSYRFEDVIPAPIITQTDDNNITITYPGSETVTLYYTTNGSRPDPANAGGNNPTQIYEVGTTTITMSNPATTVKAVAVKTKEAGEAIDTYSRCVTLTTQRYIGSSYPYLVQNVECTDFYMIPGDVKSGNTEVNTSSLFRSTMKWTFSNAGNVGGVQYYYIINSSTGDYLYHTIVGIGKDCAVYMKTSSEFGNATDKTGYMFTLVQGYSDDEKNNPDGFHIVPKSQISASNYCIYKGGWSNNSSTLANSKADVMKGSANARRPEQKHTRWNFISAPGGVLPSSLTYDSGNPSDPNWPAFLSSSTTTKYFKIENVGTAGQYMCPPTGEAAVGTATTGDNDLAWYVLEAGHDDWQKYYYIVHASTGKYLKFNKIVATPPSSMEGKSSVLSLLDYDSTTSDRYQFVLAKSTVDGAYYIVPKGLEDATFNSYYALYLEGTDPIKSTKHRESDSYKWKFVAADLFCNNPVFEEKTVGEEKKISISCTTNAAKIYYTADGTEPSEDPSKLYNTNTSWPVSEQHLIKAIAVVSDGTGSSNSDVVTLLNKPSITLKEGESVVDANTYTYDGAAKAPDVVVSITKGSTTITAPTTPAATYTVTYSKNTNARTETSIPTVSIEDANDNDTWYIWNASTTFTINQKEVGLTWTPNPASYTYNGAGQSPAATVTELVGSDVCTVTVNVSANSGSFLTGGKAVNAGSYIATASALSNSNYKLPGVVTQEFTINPVEVTLTANSGTVAYDGTMKTINGFTSSVEGLSFTGVTASGSGTNIGEYPVTFSGVTIGTTKDTSKNYIVTETVNGTLTITRKQLTITADSDTKVYDGTALTKNSYTSDGLMAGDMIESVTITGSQTDAGSSNNVPSAAVVKKGNEVVTANYNIIYNNGTLTITPKTLTVTAESKSKSYGEADPALTYTSKGLINNDAITGSLTRVAGEDVGVYAINQGTLAAGNNYAITYNGASLTITKVALTITAKNNTITYGDAPAGNGVTYEGLVNSDTESALGGTLAYDYNYTQYGDVGNTYTITPKGLTSSNYDIIFADGILTVNPKEVGLTWSETTSFAYDGSPHAPTVIATGTVNNDVITVTVTGAQTNAGEHTATASALNGDKAGNYQIPVANTQSFTISSKNIGNGTTLADGYTLDFGEGNSILLTDDAIGRTLVASTDYIVGEDQDASDKYSQRTVTGAGNYTGSFNVRNVVVSFTTDSSEEGWSATFAAEKANDTDIGHALPEGVKAFIITGIKGEWAIPEQLDYIPEGVPVLLFAYKQINGFVVTTAESGNVTPVTNTQKGNNMLEEVTDATPGYNAGSKSAPFATKQIYLLHKNEFVFNKAGNLKKGKVYLNPNHTVPASPNAVPARLRIAWSQPTGIQNQQDGRTINKESGVWYTIDGRRLNGKPSAKGLYIVDGKKAVVK